MGLTIWESLVLWTFNVSSKENLYLVRNIKLMKKLVKLYHTLNRAIDFYDLIINLGTNPLLTLFKPLSKNKNMSLDQTYRKLWHFYLNVSFIFQSTLFLGTGVKYCNVSKNNKFMICIWNQVLKLHTYCFNQL